MYPGVHNVRYVASDAAGNQAECRFSIYVKGKFMPFYIARDSFPISDFPSNRTHNMR
jgi:hypothetical protein